MLRNPKKKESNKACMICSTTISSQWAFGVRNGLKWWNYELSSLHLRIMFFFIAGVFSWCNIRYELKGICYPWGLQLQECHTPNIVLRYCALVRNVSIHVKITHSFNISRNVASSFQRLPLLLLQIYSQSIQGPPVPFCFCNPWVLSWHQTKEALERNLTLIVEKSCTPQRFNEQM